MRVYLGVDTSCYTTSVAAVDEGGRIIADCRKPLEVPEGARGLRQSDMVFRHVSALPALFEGMRARIGGATVVSVAASVKPRDVQGSYMPVFTVSEGFGRATAAALGVPFFATTHQRGHIAAGLHGSVGFCGDFWAFHLSGGTTELLRVRMDGESKADASPSSVRCPSITIGGATKDIAAGQLVDRVGVMLGLPFPAGPHLEGLAEGGVILPVKVSAGDGMCSLSGVEAQLTRLIEGGSTPPCDIAATVYDAIARTLEGMMSGVVGTGEGVLFTGGVAASARLKGLLNARNDKTGAERRYVFAQRALAGDNAVGVALIAREMGE